uniref:Uncharacterized protein n=1 Tax=Nicotiana tabacum TaxID=4097 RepID=A0A1S4DFV7_TOBAC
RQVRSFVAVRGLVYDCVRNFAACFAIEFPELKSSYLLNFFVVKKYSNLTAHLVPQKQLCSASSPLSEDCLVWKVDSKLQSMGGIKWFPKDTVILYDALSVLDGCLSCGIEGFSFKSSFL